MALQKNAGPLLTSKRYGSVQHFPEEFLASIGLVTLAQQDPVDVEPAQIGTIDLLVESSVEQTRTDERRRVDVFLTEEPSTSLESEVMLPTGLIGTRARNLVSDPTDLVVSVLTETADQRNLGNGFLDQVVVTAPELFHEQLFARERQILGAIPAEFRAGITQLITSSVVEGTAVDPGPLTGTTEYHSEQQLTVFKKKLEERGLDFSVIGTLTNYRMTSDQQLESLTVELTDVEPSPASFTATTVESEIKALGGDLWLVTEGTVPDVFRQDTFARERSILGAIPPEFRVGINTITTSHIEAGIATDPGALTGTIESASEQQITEFKKRLEQKELDFSVVGTLTNYRMTPDQQLESLTVQLTDVEPTPSSFSALTVESDIKALGGDLWLVTEGTVPDVFRKDVFSRERSILGAIPAEFRVGIQTRTTSHEEAGTAVDPGVLTGTIESATQRQITEFRRLLEQRELDFSALGSLVNYKMTPEKQLESLTATLTDVEPSPSSFSATTVESEIKALGGGLWLVTEGTVPDVFEHKTSSKELPDLIPDIFKALLPTFTTEVSVAGLIVDPPVLSTGDFFKSETQTDEFTKRVTTRGRSGLSLPQNIIVLRHLGGMEFGGETTKITGLLDNSEPTVEEGLGIVSSEVRNLGGGTWFRQTEKFDTATTWPVLESRLWDENMRVEYDETRQVVDAGTTEDADPGGVFAWKSEVRTIDQWRSWKINTSKPTPAYVDEASALVSFEYKPYRFPGYLYNSGTGYYVRHADAQLVQHKIKTWWEKSTSTPTVVVDEIIMNDVVINNLSNTGLTYSGPVLNDDLTIGTISYAASTPSSTQYHLGTPTGGSTLTNVASIFSPGTAGGYSVGDVITISSGGNSMSVAVTFVYDVDPIVGLIGATTAVDTGGTYPPGTYGPIVGTGGGGSGVYFNVFSFEQPVYTPGTQWIGTYRVVGASVTPEREKNIWKIVTESVVMR